MTDADFGVKGGVVAEVSISGGASPVPRVGVDGADDTAATSIASVSFILWATGSNGCVQCLP
jgi:hypothetical protein